MSDEELETETEALELRISKGAAAPVAAEKTLIEGAKGLAVLVLALAAEHQVPGSGALVGLSVKATSDGALEGARRYLADATLREAAQRLSDRAPEIATKRAALVAAGAGSSADVRAIFEQFLAAWTAQGDRRVRELIENAAVNAFDPEKYEQGITRRVLALLASLDYGAVALLRQIADGEDAFRAQLDANPEMAAEGWHPEGETVEPWRVHGALRRLYANELRDAYLIQVMAPSEAQDGADQRAVTTELGRHLLSYIMREAMAEAERAVDASVERGAKG